MKVFVSYSHVDAGIAESIGEALGQIDITYFLDVKDINWGDRIVDKVHGGLRDASHLVLIVSPASAKSQWVPFEVGYAVGVDVTILPFLTHPALDLPDFLRGIKYISSIEAAKEYFENEISFRTSSAGKSVDLSGKWDSNMGVVELLQDGSEINGKYQYPRYGGAEWALAENFPKYPIDGQLIGDIVIFRWTEVYGDDAWTGVGYWKIKNDDEAKGYWFHKSEVPEFLELKNDPTILLKVDSKNDRRWDLVRQKGKSRSASE